ncbi:MAG: DUF2339 domain-containing protein [Synergistaceae bacterium]|nr:DUF2339 domain-containing protein [Synergistaceae bacterium]
MDRPAVGVVPGFDRQCRGARSRAPQGERPLRNVLKLLFADLAGTGTLTRVFSFLGLGVLLMLVGWLAPLRSDP